MKKAIGLLFFCGLSVFFVKAHKDCGIYEELLTLSDDDPRLEDVVVPKAVVCLDGEIYIEEYSDCVLVGFLDSNVFVAALSENNSCYTINNYSIFWNRRCGLRIKELER